MNVTKFGHACLFLGEENNKLVIDPGKFTKLPENLKGISVVVITEEHYDHFDLDNLKLILGQSPDAKIFSTKAVCDKLEEEKIDCTAIEGSKVISESGFNLELTEGDHATVYGSSPCRVLTVCVGDFLYYPSDSFIEPGKKIKVLALPTSGPWHKLSEAIDLMKSTDAEFVLATHNGLHSEAGNNVSNHFLNMHDESPEKTFIFLSDGESKTFS